MVPAPQSRVIEMLDAIRAEFDQLTRDVYVNKSQRDDIEHKSMFPFENCRWRNSHNRSCCTVSTQLQEMHHFQQNLLEFERQQQAMKKSWVPLFWVCIIYGWRYCWHKSGRYEEEIARLRAQLEQAQARTGGHPAMPPSSGPSSVHPQAPPSHQPPQQQQPNHPPPPSIGPGSNYFGGIMNTHGNGSNQGPSGLMAPPQMGDHPPPPPPQHPMYPPSSQAPPGPPPGGAPGYVNGANNQPSYGYPPRGPAPGTPTSTHPGPIPNDAAGMPKRKSGSSTTSTSVPPGPPPPPPAAAGTMVPAGRPKSQLGMSVPPGALADVDPDSVPANMKVEGRDWFALFNPKTPRYLKVDLLHTLEHRSVVCCVKFSADGRWLAAGCNRATYIYDVATADLLW